MKRVLIIGPGASGKSTSPSDGFAESSDLLLVTSNAGRGVVDCRKGALLARDDDQFDVDIGNLLGNHRDRFRAGLRNSDSQSL